MTQDKLKSFHDDDAMMKAVESFFAEYLSDEAVKRVFRKEDTHALAEARDVLLKGFTKLRERYGVDRKAGNPNRGL
jgi:hypothetical protein